MLFPIQYRRNGGDSRETGLNVCFHLDSKFSSSLSMRPGVPAPELAFQQREAKPVKAVQRVLWTPEK